jgi:hypothetical protein
VDSGYDLGWLQGYEDAASGRGHKDLHTWSIKYADGYRDGYSEGRKTYGLSCERAARRATPDKQVGG